MKVLNFMDTLVDVSIEYSKIYDYGHLCFKRRENNFLNKIYYQLSDPGFVASNVYSTCAFDINHCIST